LIIFTKRGRKPFCFTWFSVHCLKFRLDALFNCTVGDAVLGVPSEIPLDGQIFCIFLH